jgi:phosphoglycerate kinase
LKNYKDKIVLPIDVVVANKNMDKNSIRVTDPAGVKKREIIYDIGPKTILAFSKSLKQAKTLVWNGPLGKFEHKPFDTSTLALARVVGGVSKGNCFSTVGGGETVDAVRIAGQADYIDHLSTGGGAMLEFLAGKKLPGIEALEK